MSQFQLQFRMQLGACWQEWAYLFPRSEPFQMAAQSPCGTPPHDLQRRAMRLWALSYIHFMSQRCADISGNKFGRGRFISGIARVADDTSLTTSQWRDSFIICSRQH